MWRTWLRSTGLDFKKYADLPFWIAAKVYQAANFNLDKRKPIDILDIGTGAAHFPAICAALGHRVVGIDVENSLYQDACKVFHIDRRTRGVYGGQPLPGFERKFDLITALAINFHLKGYQQNGDLIYWAIDDWAFLINDLMDNHLKRPGLISF